MNKMEPDKDLRRVLGEDQIDTVDETMMDVLSGAYDAVLAEDMETAMNAEEDRQDEEEIVDTEAEIARHILEECQGIDEDNMPKVAIGIALDTLNPFTKERRCIAQTAFCKPVLKVGIRQDFIELRFSFPSATDRDLRIMWGHLEKYGEMENAVTEESQNIPVLNIAMVPFGALGTCYMDAVNPIVWYLQPPIPGEECSQIRILMRGADVSFYETDEVSLDDAYARAQRMVNERREAYAAAVAEDEAKNNELIKNNRKMEELRRKGGQ